MRLLVYSDFHLYHNWQDFNPVQENGLPRMLNKQLQTYQEIEDVCVANKVDHKLFCGDLVHKRSFIHTMTFLPVLGMYRKHKVPEIMIGGNHDRFDQNRSVIQMLEGIPGITLLPKVEKGGGVRSVQEAIVFEKELVEIYGIMPGEEVPVVADSGFKKILLCHGAIIGAKTPTGFEMTSGYKQSDFDSFDLVCMGDIHAKQLIGKVLIPGCPISTNWGEADNEVGVWLLDTKEAFPGNSNMVNGIHLQFVPLKTSPKWIPVDQGNFDELCFSGSPEDHYDFRFNEAFSKTEIQALREKFPYSLFRAPKPEKSKAQSSQTLTRTGTLKDLLNQYVGLKQIENGALFSELGERYLTECLPKNITQGGSVVEFLWLKAENFMAFEKIEFNFTDLKQKVYLITGESIGSSSTTTNGVAKSTFAVEIICYTLFDKLARTSSRSKDRLVHKGGEENGLFTEVGLKVNDVTWVIQRYRKHKELGTGCRLLKE